MVVLCRHCRVVMVWAADKDLCNHHFNGTAVGHVLVAGAFVVRAVRGHSIEKEAVESEKKLMQGKVLEHLGHSIEKEAVEAEC